MVAIFRPTRMSLLPWRSGWTDNFLIFLSGLQKLEQRAKKCIVKPVRKDKSVIVLRYNDVRTCQ